MAEQPAISFGELLKKLRTAADLSQEELADISRVSARTISDLERGLTRGPRRETVRRLAKALDLEPSVRETFTEAAREYSPHSRPATATEADTAATGTSSGNNATGNGHASKILPLARKIAGFAAGDDPAAAGSAVADLLGNDPRSWHKLIVATLDEFGIAEAWSVVKSWQDHMAVDTAWIAWVDALIQLTEAGRLPPATHRPPPGKSRGLFVGRDAEAAELNGFVDRARQGRGGLALVLGPPGIGKSRLLIEILLPPLIGTRIEWVAFERGEAGYRGWRRLLTPMWITLRRTELAPAGLLRHVTTLDDVLLPGGDSDPAGQYLPGDVAAAVAALLEYVATSEPVVIVIDDAHRGGASSDRLLLDVASQVSACSVGIIAALRPEELEEGSPVSDYCYQAEGRVALDLVVPMRLPPLDVEETASLLKARTGAEFPDEVVGRVLQLTDGRPQLIDNTPIQAMRGGAQAASWVVGKLQEEGLRVLDVTIQSRSAQTRDVLQAAALSAVGHFIDVDLVASLTRRPADSVERILDAECERGSILALAASGYNFQHDNWIDALIASCEPSRRRLLHAECLAFLRAERIPDSLRLAQHAISAGAQLVSARELTAMAHAAADVAFADYGFGKAAELYEEAARYASGEERIELLVGQADALRFRGRWADARDALKNAASLARALDSPELEAVSLVHLDRLIWTYGLDEQDLTQQLRDAIERLPAGATVLRAQTQAVLAMRLSIAAREYETEQVDLVGAACSQLPSIADSLARADVVLGIRGGGQDYDTLDEQLARDREVLRLGIKFHSAHHIVEALSAQILDFIRSGRLPEARSAIYDLRHFAEKNPEPVIFYGLAVFDAMISLAQGDFRAASANTAEAARLSAAWGGSMANEALMAQTGWMLYESGQIDGLTEVLEEIPQQEVNKLNQPLWTLSAGLIYAEKGDKESACRALRTVCAITGDLADLPRGPSRIAIIAIAGTLLGHPAFGGVWHPGEARSWGIQIARLLAEHHDTMVIAGWPAVLLGSKHRFIGQAYLAIPEPAKAVAHLARAAEENREFAALHVRTRFDLARAHSLQSGSHAEVAVEMQQVERDAIALGMPRLAAQAAAECDR